MKKAISILSIISIAIAAVALLLFISLMTVFWEPMCVLFNSPQNIIAMGPIIPNGTIVYIVGCVLIAITTFASTKSSRAIVLEVIAIVLLAVVIPVLNWHLSMAQTSVIGYTMGATALSALSIAKQMGSFASGLMAVSEALCLVVCGMSISEKVHSRKSTPVQLNQWNK